jgi:hypothetical protein
MSEYENQARKFLEDQGLRLSIHYKDTVSDPWGNADANHGVHDKYRVTLRRTDQKGSFSFNFFNSIVAHEKHERPTAYDVLACLSLESYEPEGDKYDFFKEFGYEPSRENEALYHRVKRFAKRINAFFTDQELEKLREIS